MYKYYQSGGGHIEENEIPIEAVQREFNEETGINECNNDAFKLQRIDIYDTKGQPLLGGLRINFIYLIKTNKKPQRTEKKEHSRWILCPKWIIKRLKLKNGNLSNIRYKDSIIIDKGNQIRKDQIFELTEDFKCLTKDNYQDKLQEIIKLYKDHNKISTE